MFSFARLAVVGGAVMAVLAGCNIAGGGSSRFDAQGAGSRGPSWFANAESVDITLAEQREVDLVEEMAAHREAYRKSLLALHEYYATNGYEAKRSWAALELAGMRGVKKFAYLLDAEVPSGRLRAADSIPEADALYEQGVELMRAGGHGVPAVFRQDRVIEAAATFRRLIQQFPTSDKIDDAAFLCGEIHKEYLQGQELIAVRWYERAWKWDPDTPHPARFQAAVVYDYRLHDRDRALELYHAVADDPNGTPRNARFAVRRIADLTDGESAVKAAQR